MGTVASRAGTRARPSWAIRRLVIVLAVATTVLVPMGGPAQAAGPPAGFEDVVIAAIDAPMDIAWTPDGAMLIPSKGGQLWVVENGAVLPTPAIDLSGVMCTNGERALGGVAVHPDYETNHYVYLYYTYNKNGTCNESEVDGPVNRLSRFVLPHSNVIDPASETVLFDTPPLFRDHHNSGDIEFGSDGYLYVTVGDGGTRRFGWPQDPGRLLGKIVRLTDSGGIPPGNPYTGSDSARCNVDGVPPAGSPAGTKCQEVFSQGLRNPFRFAFDPNAAGTRFYVNDVGQSSYEEISEGAIAGADYGWPEREGPCAFETTDCTEAGAGLTDPVHWYSHGPFGGAATGGAFVPNGVWPAAYDGAYLFADYVFGKIYTLTPGGSECRTCDPPVSAMVQSDFTDALQVVEMAFGPHGTTQALYYVSRESDAVHRIAYVGAANRAPTAVATIDETAGALPFPVQFDGTASSDPDGDPLSYEWDFDGDGTIDATDPAPLHTYTTAGTVDASLTVNDGRGGSDTATITLHPGNEPPTPIIEVPADGATFAVGDEITMHGSALDPEDGALGDASLSWEVRQHHAEHWHPLVAPTPGNDISFFAPEPEDLLASTNSYVEVRLTATDSGGVSTTVSRDVQPRKVDLSFDTVPSGLTLTIDDAPVTTPQTVVSWENHDLRVEAPDQTDGTGGSWAWSSWSDGGAQSHTIAVGSAPASYSASFTEAAPTTLVFGPTDDATIRADKPDRNLGADDVVEGDASPPKDGLLRFDVSGLAGRQVATATLRLFVTNSSPIGGEFRLTDPGWSEDTVTWNTAPASSGAIIASPVEVDSGSWVDIDVTSAIVADGPVSLRFSSTSRNGVDYASKESTTGNYPELIVEVGDPPGPDETAPTPPSSLVAVADTPTEVELDWNAASDNVAVVAYEIHRDGGLLDTVGPVLAYEDFSVSPNSTYEYEVRARDAAGNVSGPSNAAMVTTPGPDITPPTPPSTLVASASGPTEIELVWTAATDDVEVFGYDVYRGGAFLDSIGPVTSFIDATVAPEGTYEYFLRARDAAGNVSDPSNTASATTPAAPSVLDFAPTDDATIRESRPDRNLGSDEVVEVDASSRKDGLLRFDVTGVGSQPIVSAVLHLYVENSSSFGGAFSLTSDTAWSEDTVTWATAPAGDAGLVGTLGEARSGTWVALDVTAAVLGDGPVSFRASSISSNGVDYASKEHIGGNAPRLSVELG